MTLRVSQMASGARPTGAEKVGLVQGGNTRELSLAQIAGSPRTPYAPGVFTYGAIIDDLVLPALDEAGGSTLISLQANDDMGTRLSGIDATAWSIGTVLDVMNLSTPVDAGELVLLHNSSRSAAANRFRCPNDRDFLAPKDGGFRLARAYLVPPRPGIDGETPSWFVLATTRFMHLATHSLSLHPHLVMEPITGNVDAYDPTAHSALGDTPYEGGLFACGVSGLGKDGTVWYLSTADAGGAVLKGIKWRPHTDTDPAGHGPVRVLKNLGPGAITVKHHGAADPNDYVHSATGDLVMPVWGSITVSGAQMGGYWVIAKNF